MVNFNRLSALQEKKPVIPPREIFARLPKPPTIDDLHSSQADVLDTWYENRNLKDTVIKLNTGGGKTLVGLLIALSSARELGLGALYLVDSKQLAQQACEQAKALGIDAFVYEGRQSITADFRNGNSILIAHYRALFNGKSSFGLSGANEPEEVSAIIIDDAHSSFESIRDAFTVEIHGQDDRETFRQVANLFRDSFIAIDRGTTFDEFVSETGSIGEDVLEVPFWAWIDNAQNVARIISADRARLINREGATRDSILFSWPLIKDDLKYCQATISRGVISIAPMVPLMDKFPTFKSARRRIYMSATIADEAEIIRTFGCKSEEINTIFPNTLAGVGRRMILQLDGKESYFKVLVRRMQSLAKSGAGVVVLEPSFSRAEQWVQHGVRVIRPEEVGSVIADLRRGAQNDPVVFSNRYNGLDLPGDACRLLLVSGVPMAVSDFQRLFSKTMSQSRVYAKSIAQNIEQAIGRGTRGSGDYCVVILYGHDLCEWVNDRRHASLFTLATQAQIACGIDIMSEVSTPVEFGEVIDQGLSDDQGFASYLSDYVANYVSNACESGDDGLGKFAIVERKAFAQWRGGLEDEAVTNLTNYATEESEDVYSRGLALQIAAQIEYATGKIDKSKELQECAHSLNTSLIKSALPLTSSKEGQSNLSLYSSAGSGFENNENYDAFISYASEDGETFVRPLAKALKSAGIKIWYDDFSLSIGDSLREKIDYGLAHSRFGVAVLSPHFFEKSWPQYELDAIIEQVIENKQRILPIWYNLTHDELMKISPALAGRLAIDASGKDIPIIARELIKEIMKEQ